MIEFENEVLREIYGLKKDEVGKKCKMLHKVEICNFCRSSRGHAVA
jgi:hypothetical protein